MRLEISVFGEDLVSRDLLRMGDRAEDMRPVWPEIVALLRGDARRQFSGNGGEGGSWPELKPATIKRKAARGLDPRILRAHRLLEQSLTSGSSPLKREVRSRDELRFGTKVPYYIHHHFGAPGANLPRRRALVASERTKKAAVKILQRYVVEKDRG